jgi:hypothetical protein
MLKSTRSKAEAQFLATQKKAKQALKEKEKVRLEKAEHTAKLRALRLAKEAADAGETDTADDAAPSLPQVHRQQS